MSPHAPQTKKRKKVDDDNSDGDDQAKKIWVDGRYIDRPKNIVTSHGVLMYSKREERGGFKYLLGLIPQGNAWTVFKGLPSSASGEREETPWRTAVREFEEETSLQFPFQGAQAEGAIKETTLYGVTSGRKKLLEIFLVEAPDEWNDEFVRDRFDVNKVVKIDSGFMAGRPEIVQIRFLTLKEAVEGTRENGKTAKIYKSQIGILQRAEEFLKTQKANQNTVALL